MCIQFQSVQGKGIPWGPSCSPLNLEENCSTTGPKARATEQSNVGRVPKVTRLPCNWATRPLGCLPHTTGTAGDAQSGRSLAQDSKALLCPGNSTQTSHHGTPPPPAWLLQSPEELKRSQSPFPLTRAGAAKRPLAAFCVWC